VRYAEHRDFIMDRTMLTFTAARGLGAET